MAVFGSTINPALGRVDYSPLAQGMAQGGALAAQGMAAMGQGLSEGFREYVKKREQNAILEGKNAALLREIGRDPMLASNPEIQKYTAKMAKGGGLTLNDNIKMHAELTTTAEAARMRQEEKRQQDYLKLQQDAAAINAARAAREKAEYERKNEFQTRMIAGLRENPEALKNPDLAMQLAISKGGTFDDVRSVFGDAARIEDYARNKDTFELDREERKLKIARLKVEQDASKADGSVFEVKDVDGVRMAIFYDKFKNIIGREVIKAEPPSQGQKLRSEASKYYAALNSGNTAAAAEAVANARRLTAGQKFENYEDDEFAEKVFGPFRGDLGETPAAGPQEKLVVKGGLKPVSPTPSPTSEDSTITKPQGQEPSVSGKSFYKMGTPFSGAGGVTVIHSSDAEVAEQQRQIDAAMGIQPQQAAPPSPRTQPLIPQSIESASIPFGPAAMDSAFLDREAQATDRGAYRPFDAAMAERYQTPSQGAIPQIKLSPAAQKIASELRRSAQSGERGKAPQFFLEASTGDNGKRTRVKLDRNELFAILTNNPMPNLSPTLEVDREETRRLMDQQMRMNELMRQYRPPARRAR